MFHLMVHLIDLHVFICLAALLIIQLFVDIIFSRYLLIYLSQIANVTSTCFHGCSGLSLLRELKEQNEHQKQQATGGLRKLNKDKFIICTLNIMLFIWEERESVCCQHEFSGFGGLEDACWPLVLKFAGSNPAEAVGYFRAKKFPARLPSEGK
jgi:hypothetical protein